MNKKTILFSLFLLFSVALQAQEYLSGLMSNPALNQKENNISAAKLNVYVTLPFLDDFSYPNSVYPADTLWKDRKVFINSDYAINPPSVGVATFDAINDTGAVYASATTTPFVADSLTSLPVRLDSVFSGTPGPVTVADSIYFSFYYQPQGVGDSPEIGDSLLLEFYSPHLKKWYRKWSSPGMKLDTFLAKYNSYFRHVMVPITDTTFIQKGFQFRFRNYASIASMSLPSWQSNCDQWNIDYVYLNIGRSKYDTVSPDITFTTPASSLLKNYAQMPARQYSNSDLRDSLHLKISNLNNVLDNISYQYCVKQDDGPFSYCKSGGVWDIYPFITNGCLDYQPISDPVIDFSFPSFSGLDSIGFTMKHMISSNGWTDKIISNDTITFHQNFYNYFAYDDGTAENGYGLTGENSKLAYKFTLNKPDTLGGVQFYFNQTYTSPYSKYFYIVVWSSLNPETIIYKSAHKRPEFMDSINAYYTYLIDDTTLLVNGTIYVGWQQQTDNNLNVGFDRNTDSRSNISYNVDGTWTNSSFSGSLMIRPLVGTAWQEAFSGIKEHNLENNSFVVFPNPLNGNIINLQIASDEGIMLKKEKILVEIFNNMGQMVLQRPYSESIDVSALQGGVYIIRLAGLSENKPCFSKLVITR